MKPIYIIAGGVTVLLIGVLIINIWQSRISPDVLSTHQISPTIPSPTTAQIMTNPSQLPTSTPVPRLNKTEVAKHTTSTDCWTIISGKVYNITNYIPLHPGGSEILLACGTDATNFFNGTIKPGRQHSAIASQLLVRYLIGNLE